MEDYARCAQSSTNINGIHYMMGFMMRVKPERIRYSDSQKDYWVLNGSTDEMRPYRIMVKAQGVEDDNGFLIIFGLIWLILALFGVILFEREINFGYFNKNNKFFVS